MFICPKKIAMALLFMILASSQAFQAVRSVAGGWISTAEGLPKVGGLAVHALVFIVLSTLIWRYMPFGSSNFEGDEEFRVKKRGGFFKKAMKAESSYEDEDYEDEDFRLSKAERRARRAERRAARAD